MWGRLDSSGNTVPGLNFTFIMHLHDLHNDKSTDLKNPKNIYAIRNDRHRERRGKGAFSNLENGKTPLILRYCSNCIPPPPILLSGKWSWLQSWSQATKVETNSPLSYIFLQVLPWTVKPRTSKIILLSTSKNKKNKGTNLKTKRYIWNLQKKLKETNL